MGDANTKRLVPDRKTAFIFRELLHGNELGHYASTIRKWR